MACVLAALRWQGPVGHLLEVTSANLLPWALMSPQALVLQQESRLRTRQQPGVPGAPCCPAPSFACEDGTSDQAPGSRSITDCFDSNQESSATVYKRFSRRSAALFFPTTSALRSGTLTSVRAFLRGGPRCARPTEVARLGTGRVMRGSANCAELCR